MLVRILDRDPADRGEGIDASLANTSLFFTRGRTPPPFELSLDNTIARSAVDSENAQEGAMQLQWSGAGKARITGPELALVRETNADMNVQVAYRVVQAPTGPVTLTLGGGSVTVTDALDRSVGWHVMRIPLKCLRDAGANMEKVTEPFALSAAAPFAIAISDVRLATDPAGSVCPK